jgi:aminopeptidase N
LVIPVAMGLLDGNGQELATRLEDEAEPTAGTRVLLAKDAETSFEFVDVASPPVPSLLRGFSAPVKLSGVSAERLRFLAAHDTDPFVRWDSGQQYAASVLLDMVATLQAGGQPSVDPALIEAAAAALDQEPAFAAEALVLPGEATLADKMSVVDPSAIHTARDLARAAIGQALADRLRATYDRLTDNGGYRIDGAAIGARSLRNTCLSYLVASGDPSALGLAKMQFDAGQNMTDVLAALGVLSAVDCAERTAALAAFYAAWRGDPLVLDKWFGIQALSPLPGTIAAVVALKQHPDFDLRNPNRVRALVSSFAGNQVRFHDASGAGYRLYADTIIDLDPLNGQVAARMVSPLGQWRRFDAGRQALMRGELRRILDLPALSRNTFEMASKSLGA